MLIRPALAGDAASIWSIIGPVIRAGETYALDPDMSEADALAYWLGADRETFVAEADGAILGTYYLRRNQAGGGSHVSNCGYMTAAAAAGAAWGAPCAGIRSIMPARAAIAPCSSISCCRATNARCGSGKG